MGLRSPPMRRTRGASCGNRRTLLSSPAGRRSGITSATDVGTEPAPSHKSCSNWGGQSDAEDGDCRGVSYWGFGRLPGTQVTFFCDPADRRSSEGRDAGNVAAQDAGTDRQCRQLVSAKYRLCQSPLPQHCPGKGGRTGVDSHAVALQQDPITAKSRTQAIALK